MPLKASAVLTLFLTLFMGLLTLPFPGMAQTPGDSRLEALGTLDSGRNWLAVGRLNTGGGSFCTATLIAPDRVLTAAHCLYQRDTHRPVALGDVEFLAGWRSGRAEAIRGVRRAAIEPSFTMEGGRSLARVANDLAVLELDRPIRLTGLQPIPVEGRMPAAGSAVAVVSYARERAEAPSLQDRCTVLERRRDRVVVMSCEIDFGSSGAPVFTLDGGVPRIVSVISALARTDQGDRALGMQIGGRIEALMAELDNPPVQRPGLDGGHGGGMQGGGARDTARFVRP